MGNHHGRTALLGFGVLLVIASAATLYRGVLGWTNYRGAFVFSPFAMIVGALMVIAAFKKPPSRRRRHRDRSGFSWTK